MAYVDGFVLPIAEEKVDEYRKVASEAAKVWMEHGALSYMECVGDDLTPHAETGQFLKLASCRPGETVVFSWITYESRAHRDRVNEAVMKDPRIADLGPESMPFDCGRMAWGGFKAIVEA